MSHGSAYVPVVTLVGDSIDHGFGAGTLAGYEQGVYFAAQAAGTPIFFVGASSFAGNSNGLAVDPWNDAVNGSLIGVAPTLASKPDIILAGGGTNNVGSGQNASTVLAAFSSYLDSLYACIRFKSWGRIVFRNILLRNDASSGTYNPIITAINAGLQGVVNTKAYASQVAIADVASAVNPLTQLGGDGLHPLDSGYTSMVTPIWNALSPAVAAVKSAGGVG